MLLGSSPHFVFFEDRMFSEKNDAHFPFGLFWENHQKYKYCSWFSHLFCWFFPFKKKKHKITQLWEDPNCDGFLVILTPQAMTAPTDCAVALTKYAKIQGSDDPSPTGPTGPTSPGIYQPTLVRSDRNFFMFGLKKNRAYARPKQWWENWDPISRVMKVVSGLRVFN